MVEPVVDPVPAAEPVPPAAPVAVLAVPLPPGLVAVGGSPALVAGTMPGGHACVPAPPVVAAVPGWPDGWPGVA
jgi:hypothetical protein